MTGLKRAQERQAARDYWKQYCRQNRLLRGHKGVPLGLIVREMKKRGLLPA